MRISSSAAIGVTGHEPHQSRSGSDIRVINRNASIRGQTARITHLQVEVNARAYGHGRIVRSILLEEPDRIPLSLNIRPEPYEQLMATLGVSDKGMTGHIEVVKSLNVDL